MKRILMIAFHYPPYMGGSGIHRSLKFSHYLPNYGWQPIVLSADPIAYPNAEKITRFDSKKNIIVKRAFSLDSARHLSIQGSYLRCTALPDRWVSWWSFAVLYGLFLIYKYNPKIIWSTYPIATAHLIGFTLHSLTKIPWVADFRDSMTEEGYPSDSATRRVYQKIERLTVKHCKRAVFTTPGALWMYSNRYPHENKSKWKVIANGYDEEEFDKIENTIETGKSNSKLTMIHSGVIYPSERDPSYFFSAISDLHKMNKISPDNLKIILRASGNEKQYSQQLREKGIENIVFLKPAIPYNYALKEILSADALLLLQASNCNHQIPAKIYEYLRARKPILALTDIEGDTANLLIKEGINTIIKWNSKNEIANGMLKFMRKIVEGTAPVAKKENIRIHSRQYRTKELADLLKSLEV